jgi:hypothetical protein
MRGSAILSPDGVYRYALSRWWSDPAENLPLVWVMLNPSTADARRNDPTIRRCIAFSQAWGYGGLYVVNLFALRSPDPSYLRAHSHSVRVGPDNDRWIRSIQRKGPSCVIAWGANGRYFPKRVEAVLKILRKHGTIRCLGLTREGHPRHPLMLSADTKLEMYAGLPQ